MSSRGAAIAAVLAMTIGLTAQQPVGLKTGNPTPGTPQPDPPNLANRITLTGCVEAVTEASRANGPTPVDANTPSDSRFVLTKAERVELDGSGTSIPPAAGSSRTYRLNAIASQLSVFVGMRVTISGELLSTTAKDASSTDNAPGFDPPTLQVQVVQKLAPTCS